MTRILLVISMAHLLFTCAAPVTVEQESMPAFDESYRTLHFTDSNRLHKLKAAFGAVDKIYTEHATKNHFPAIVYGIVLGDSLIYSRAAGVLNIESNIPAKPTSLFRIASMTKSFTAMAILKLRDEGKLSITDPAERYAPEMKSFRYLTSDSPKITIENLLTMTAGFPEDNPWGDRQLEDTDEEFLGFLKEGVSFSNIPGHRFEYSNLGYAILGNIISRVSGVPYQRYITQNILGPLGMKDTKWEYTEVGKQDLALGYRWEDETWKLEPMLHDGAYGAMGGLITSIGDFSKYIALHLKASLPSSLPETGPVKRNSIRQMHKPFLSSLYPEAKTPGGAVCPTLAGYGYGLGYRQDCKGVVRISHSGGLPGFGSEFRFYPEYGIGVVSFANRTYAGTGVLNGRVLDTLISLAGLAPRTLPPSEMLSKRKEQLIELLQTWDEKLGAEILAENFYLDRSRESWMRFAREIKDQTGKFIAYEPILPENQLRGTFRIIGEKNVAEVFFTLSPEKDPKIQQLDLRIIDAEERQR
jgi:CubicO group peptidase (beta-lactamase class C family)